MTTDLTQGQSKSPGGFVWVFFENLGEGAYTPAGYAGVINYYINASHSPAWKWLLGGIASHAGLAAPMQAETEISLVILLVIGLLTRPAAFFAFLFPGSLWASEWGTSWIWGNYWFRCSHRSDSRWGTQAEPGASTRCWHGGAPRRRGGDE